MSWRRSILIFAIAGLLTSPLAADWAAGVTAFKAGDWEIAEAEFRAVVETMPNWPGGHRMLGQTILRDGRIEEALTPLKRAYELASDDLGTALALGQAYFALDRFAETAGVLESQNPAPLPEADQVRFFKTRAVARAHSGQSSAALDDFEHALALVPGDPELHRLAAQTAETTGRTEVAIPHLRRLIELEPKNIRPLRSLALFLYDRAARATEEEQAGLCREVMPHAARLAKLDDGYDHLVLLAKASACAGFDETAQTSLELAAAARPDAWWPQYKLGRLHLRLEHWDQAEIAFQSALAKAPDEEGPKLHRQLAYAFERQEQLDKALAEYRLAEDAEGIARVEKNREALIEEAKYKKLAEEKKRLEEELAKLDGLPDPN